MLELQDVSARYDPKVTVLRHVSLKAAEGQTTCVLGSNGAGKTTLLKTIMGLIPSRVGAIRLAGEPIHHLKAHQIVRRGLAVVPEQRQLFPKLTVAETLELGAYKDAGAVIVRKRYDLVFGLFPVLAERRRQLSGTLSGGELGMLSIARALMAGPRMILLDEPSLGLAPKAVSRVFRTIQDINRQGISILLIEQNAKKSLAIASYGYVMQKGAIAAEGDVTALRESEIVRRAYLRG
ncbi:MAG: ABC transporter ATP-binding protein [Hyphomicrobiaceae bacterium]|nr:ABC transporter ATP-binding protein [Hyphomicrobiaceae bacterium]